MFHPFLADYREILMTASSKIKTPTMDVPILLNPDCLSKARRLQKQLSKVYLCDVSGIVYVLACFTVGKGICSSSWSLLHTFKVYLLTTILTKLADVKMIVDV